jgi:hypothetical protein
MKIARGLKCSAVGLVIAVSACGSDAQPNAQAGAEPEVLADINNGGLLSGSVSPAGAGDVNVKGPCGDTSCVVQWLQPASIEAVARPGFRFVGWSNCSAVTLGGASPSAPTLTYAAVTLPETCLASFEAVDGSGGLPQPGNGQPTVTLASTGLVSVSGSTTEGGSCSGATCSVPAGGLVQFDIEVSPSGEGAAPLLTGLRDCPDATFSATPYPDRVYYRIQLPNVTASRTCTPVLEPGTVFSFNSQRSPLDLQLTEGRNYCYYYNSFHAHCVVAAGTRATATSQPNTNAFTWQGWQCNDGQGTIDRTLQVEPARAGLPTICEGVYQPW